MSGNDEWMSVLIKILNNLWNSDEWSSKVHCLHPDEYIGQIIANNTSMSFTFEESRARHLIKLQQQLDVRGYRIPRNIYLLKDMVSYRVSYDYPFVDQVNGIIQRIKSAGLYDVWFEEDLRVWLKMIRLANKSVVPRENAGQIEFRLIVYGWISVSVVFVGELLWKRIRILMNMKCGH